MAMSPSWQIPTSHRQPTYEGLKPLEFASWAEKLDLSPAYLRGIETAPSRLLGLAVPLGSPAYLRGIETAVSDLGEAQDDRPIASLPTRD